MTDLTTKVARGFRWSMVDTALQQIVRFAITIVLTRLIAPEDFGLLAMALVFTALASLVGDLGLGPALVQRERITKRHIETANSATLAFGVLLSIVVFVLAAPIASFYDEPRLTAILQVLSATYLFRGIAGVPRDLLRRAMRFDLFVIASAISIGISGAVGLILAFSDKGVWALVIQVLLESALGAVTATVLAYRRKLWKPRYQRNVAAFKDLAGFGAFVSGTRLAGYGVSNIDNLIVGKVLGSTALGLYNLAYRLMLFPILKVADVVANVTMPALSKLQGQPERLANGHRRALEAVSLVCFPVSFGIAVAAPALVPAIFGSAWLPAVLVTQILAVNGARLAFGRVNGAVFQAAGKPSWDFGLVLLTLVAYIVAFTVGVQHGIVGVAWAFTIAGHLLLPLDFYLITRVLGIRIRELLANVAPIAFAAVVMALAIEFFMSLTGDWGSGTQSLGAIGVGIVSYAALLFLVAPTVLKSTAKQLVRR